MKKLILLAIIATFVGCTTSDCCTGDSYYDPNTNSTLKVEFNQETYVWETLNFSTNRADKVR